MKDDMLGTYERTCLSFKPLRETLKKRGITDLQLARQVGVKVDVIRNMYKYQDTITLSLVRSICEALDCCLDELMTAEKVMVIPIKKKTPDA